MKGVDVQASRERGGGGARAYCSGEVSHILSSSSEVLDSWEEGLSGGDSCGISGEVLLMLELGEEFSNCIHGFAGLGWVG